MDIQKTTVFYENLSSKDLCDCAYCKNYSLQIDATYPQFSAYLRSLGIDTTKPFETSPLEVDVDGYIDYVGVQYIVLGDALNFHQTVIQGVTIDIAKSYPTTTVKESHFVIEVYPIRLKWVI